MKFDSGLADVLALVLHHPGLQGAEDRLGRLLELLAGVAHLHPEPVELDLAGPPAEAEDEPAVGHVVEQHDLLGDAQRVVPRQHDHHRPELHLPGTPGHVSQELFSGCAAAARAKPLVFTRLAEYGFGRR